MTRVVVTGMGMINALGLDKDSSFDAICSGKSGVDKITLFDTSDFPVQIAAEVKGFDPATIIDAKEIKKLESKLPAIIRSAKRFMPDAGYHLSEEYDSNMLIQAVYNLSPLTDDCSPVSIADCLGIG